MPASLHVIVVGGGIGGLGAALALARTGARVTVLEQARQFAEIGAGIQLAPNATRVLARWGLLDGVRAAGVEPRRIVLADARTTAELTHLPLADFPQRYGGPYVVLHRHDLLQLLLQACREAGVELVTGAAVTAVRTDGPRARVGTADGLGHEADLVVGADGLRSALRRLVVDDELVNSGYVAYRGAVPMSQVERHADLRDVVAWVGPGLHLVQYPLRSGEMYNQVAVFRSPSFARGEADWGRPEELDAVFAPMSEHARASIRLLGRDQRWPMYDRLPVGTWVAGRVVLLGDAAHPMLQYLAQGACQALQDAESLARHLGEGSDVPAALAAYQAERAPHTARVQRTARFWGELWHLDGVGATLRNVLLAQRRPDDQTHVDWLYGEQEGGSGAVAA